MSSPAVDAPRRQLSGRNPEMVARLLDAAVVEVAATGYEGLTVRNVARAAGVSPASAYTYFASKEHLLAEVFWRRIAALPPVVLPRGAGLEERVEAAVTPIALLVADEPELASGVTTALLAHDADVRRLRDQIGTVFAERLQLALGSEATPEALLGLSMTLTGALLMAGMGNLDYRDLGPRVAGFAALLSKRRKRT
jgi:AcrR family transcriptional regulator